MRQWYGYGYVVGVSVSPEAEGQNASPGLRFAQVALVHRSYIRFVEARRVPCTGTVGCCTRSPIGGGIIVAVLGARMIHF
jgi:hypothetical protein